MSKRRHRAALATVAICLVLAACLPLPGCGAGGPSVYKVGVIVSLSGPAAPLGLSEQRSINLLSRQIAAKGGIDGRKVEFLIQDDESDPQKANLAMARLVDQEKVPVVIGCSTSGSTLAIAPTAEMKNIPVVAMAAGTTLTRPVRKYLFSVAPSDSLVVSRVLDYFKINMKVGRIAILHDANAYGTGGANEVVGSAPAYGMQVVANESYGSADTDMTVQLTRIEATSAEAILVWGTNPGPAIIARNMRQLGIRIPFVGSSGIANKTFIELAGDAANGVVFAASKLILPQTITDEGWSEAVKEFSEAYRKEYGVVIDTFAAHGWDAANMVANALEAVGADPAGILGHIQGLKRYPGVDGVFTYSAKDHAGLKVDALVMVRIENGDWTEAGSE